MFVNNRNFSGYRLSHRVTENTKKALNDVSLNSEVRYTMQIHKLILTIRHPTPYEFLYHNQLFFSYLIVFLQVIQKIVRDLYAAKPVTCGNFPLFEAAANPWMRSNVCSILRSCLLVDCHVATLLAMKSFGA